MSENYDNAVAWLTPICSRLVRDGRLNLPEMCFWEPYLELKLSVRPYNGGYIVSEGSALALVELSEQLPGAFDLCCKVCAANLVNGSPIPEFMRLFAAQALMGQIRRPKGRRGDMTWLANQYKYSLILQASKHFKLDKTRGDNNPPISACDAVSDALKNCGHHVDYFSLKRLCVERRYERMREEWRLWATKASEVGLGALTEIYSIPDDLNPRVADGGANSDTREGA